LVDSHVSINHTVYRVGMPTLRYSGEEVKYILRFSRLISTMTQRLILASNNAGKLKEFQQILGPIGFTLHPQGEFDVPEAEEPHATFVENALEKARHASRLTGLPALADDSGVCVNALGGAPGVYSARFAGEPKSDARNNEKLVAELADKADKSAYYYCVLVYVRHADDPQPVIADGRWDGVILDTPRGENGFGYDPYFLIPALGKTTAELTPAEKNARSHRGQALRALVEKLR
jgi:XTP/dITP diphosphohydrolase